MAKSKCPNARGAAQLEREERGERERGKEGEEGEGDTTKLLANFIG